MDESPAFTGFDPMDTTFSLEMAARAAEHARRRLRDLAIAAALRQEAARGGIS